MKAEVREGGWGRGEDEREGTSIYRHIGPWCSPSGFTGLAEFPCLSPYSSTSPYMYVPAMHYPWNRGQWGLPGKGLDDGQGTVSAHASTARIFFTCIV